MKWCALAVIFFAACGDNRSGGGDDGGGSGNTCLPDCPASRAYDAISYHLAAHYDWVAGQLVGTETVLLDTAQSGPIVELDAAMAISAVHDTAGAALPYVADPAAGTLHVDLTRLAGAADGGMFQIEYTAAPSTSLIATASRDDDPVTSHVVYTDSEPNRGLYWLATKLDPSDRALWGVDLQVGPGEDVVANGERITETDDGGGRRTISYALDKPIPPYLMAFAAGELDHTDRPTGSSVPLSVWYRHGFVLDPDRTLDAIADAMATFESLVGPYPWARYSVVLLPYGGGMENATITFDNETSGQGPIDFGLVAHELAHHWFGDWVTMHGYDDVWFKEGMATVLQSVADRARRDRESKGREYGTDFGYRPTEAIVDDSLIGIDKYTTGPYQHAAWLITQIRGRVGDAAFWVGLKKLLADYPTGSATGEQFIHSFVDLDAATVQQLVGALPTMQTPKLAVTIGAVAAGGTPVTIGLTDPSGIMIDPIDITVIGDTGTATTNSIGVGEAATVMVPVGGYLAFDEVDRSPSLTTDFGMDTTTFRNLRALFAPAPTALPAVLAAFESRSAAQQERVAAVPLATAAGWSAYYAALDSNRAQATAVALACGKGQTDGTWLTAIDAQLETPPREVFDTRLVACGTAKPQTAFEAELAAALAGGTPAQLARVQYLLAFDYGDDAIDVIGPVVKTAPQLTLRDLALTRLIYEAQNLVAYTPVAAAKKPAWDALFEGELVTTMSENRFDDVIGAVGALADVGALAKIAALLHAPQISGPSQAYAACTVFGFATGADLSAFEAAAMPYSTLDPQAAAILSSGGQGCGSSARPHRRPEHR